MVFFKDLKAIKYDSALIFELISLNGNHDADEDGEQLLKHLEHFILERLDKNQS